jgi:hypothetical protein
MDTVSVLVVALLARAKRSPVPEVAAVHIVGADLNLELCPGAVVGVSRSRRPCQGCDRYDARGKRS